MAIVSVRANTALSTNKRLNSSSLRAPRAVLCYTAFHSTTAVTTLIQIGKRAYTLGAISWKVALYEIIFGLMQMGIVLSKLELGEFIISIDLHCICVCACKCACVFFVLFCFLFAECKTPAI